jgi:transcriptional regulator with XRE-family HTH domain
VSTNVGALIQACRERVRMTQSDLAARVPLSQKQVSRIECGQYVQIPRATVIRLAEVLGEPLITGEVNLWLSLLGFAPLIRPGLPIPDGLIEAIRRADPVPTWCVGPLGRVLAANRSGWALTGHHEDFSLLRYLVAHESAFAPELRARFLAILLYWAASAGPEPWLAELRADLPASIQDHWETLPLEHTRSNPVAGLSDPIQIVVEGAPPLQFRVAFIFPVPRPDLLVAHFYPLGAATQRWCRQAAKADAGPSALRPRLVHSHRA